MMKSASKLIALSSAALLSAQFGTQANAAAPACKIKDLEAAATQAGHKPLTLPDLRSHPLAGTEIRLRLKAFDHLKQEGPSNAVACPEPDAGRPAARSGTGRA
ncbi:MAG TPA: hypothetical protein PLO23_01050 [Alphaproteobacteria bacterium]|nr:hypothetical protein [Alphaproteobacteria bacterium]